jgi:hypothetical protein
MTLPLSPAIQGVRLCALKGALSLECKGLKHSRGSVYALVKREFGFKGNKLSVLNQLKEHITKFNKEHGFEK